jgi:very-short-patch-repair endonuclease
MRAGNAFSHVTAARLYGLPLPSYVPSDGPIDVTSPSDVTPPYGRGVRGHRLARDRWRARDVVHFDTETGELFALPVLAPEVVWAQLSAVLDPMDLVALGDAIVVGETPLGDLAALRSAALAFAGIHSSSALIRAGARVRIGARSRTESVLRQMMEAVHLPVPQLNIPVLDRAGLEIGVADFVWPEFRVLVEYEGDGHRSRGKFRSDIVRFETYADNDWSALRSQADDLFIDPDPFLGRLSRRLRSAGWQARRRESRQIAPARR